MKQIALLRAINVAGRNIVSMTKLIKLSEQFGSTNNKTVLQSGNLVFENAQVIREEEFESELAQSLHINTDVMIRTDSDWKNTVDSNPFKDMAVKDPSHLLVLFLKSVPLDESVHALRAAITGLEQIHLHGKDLYVTYPDGIGRSKFTTKILEKYLGVPFTGRNWNTILKINNLLHTNYSTASMSSGGEIITSTKAPSTSMEIATGDRDSKDVEKLSRKRSRG